MKHLIGAVALGAFVLSALPAAASDRGRHDHPARDMSVSVVLVSPGISLSFGYPGPWYAPHRDWKPPRHREWVPGHWEYRSDCDRGWRHGDRGRHTYNRRDSGSRPRWR